MAVLLVTATLTVMASEVIAPSLPGPGAEFSDVAHADLLVRPMLTLPALFIAMAAPLLGTLVDRVGRRTVLPAFLVLCGLAGRSGLVLSSLYTALARCALLGVAVGGVFVASTALIADWFSGPDRARMLGLQAAFTGIGGAVLPTLGGFLASIDPRGPFVVYVVPTQLPFYPAGLTGAGPLTSGLAIALLDVVGVVVSLNLGRVRARFSFPAIAAAIFVAIGVGLLLVGAASSLPLVLVGLAVAGLGTGLAAAGAERLDRPRHPCGPAGAALACCPRRSTWGSSSRPWSASPWPGSPAWARRSSSRRGCAPWSPSAWR